MGFESSWKSGGCALRFFNLFLISVKSQSCWLIDRLNSYVPPDVPTLDLDRFTSSPVISDLKDFNGVIGANSGLSDTGGFLKFGAPGAQTQLVSHSFPVKHDQRWMICGPQF
jgi:hypothetical protein